MGLVGMAGPELEEAVAWIEVSLKGRMVDAGEGLLKKERNVFRELDQAATVDGPDQNLIAKVGGYDKQPDDASFLVCWIRNEMAERGE